MLAVVSAQVSTWLGKLLYERPRPDDRLIEAVSASFPSGHATNAAVTGLTLVLVLVLPGARRRRWLALAVGYALAMAWSRTYLRVHWLSDVTGGFLSGIAWALLGALLASRWIGSRHNTTTAPGSRL
jgi:undecaprenyl-diphosphatase